MCTASTSVFTFSFELTLAFTAVEVLFETRWLIFLDTPARSQNKQLEVEEEGLCRE